jgi:EAL domain-containing protein (putative c-di-GMP-specific phosphodiesterase class I)
VIAEGVEEHEEMEALMKLGCGQFQGYLFDKPQPVDVITQRLKENSYGETRAAAMLKSS